MSGGNYAQMGMAGTGAILGGIGDIIQAQNYHQPKLAPATGYEQRLRQLAQSQLIGGGQELLGGTALYNQMAPLLMSQLPGMHYVPGSDGAGGGGGGGGSPAGDYGSALQNYQDILALQQQKTAARAAMKGAKKGPEKQAARQTLKGIKRQIRSQPTTAERERQMYVAGAQPGSFDIRQGPAPSMQSSLGDINALIGQRTGPDLLSLYRGG